MHFSSAPSFHEESFNELILDHEPLQERAFSDCQFLNGRFDQVDFTSTTFSDCTFDHCELNLPILVDCALRTIRFKGCKLVGVDFTKCNLNFFALSFENCLIDTCNFSGLKLKRTPFLRCIIRETRFIQSFLSEANFTSSDLEHTLFHQCDLEQTNFTNAKNYSIDPTTNKIKGARFSLPEAVSLLTTLGIALVQ